MILFLPSREDSGHSCVTVLMLAAKHVVNHSLANQYVVNGRLSGNVVSRQRCSPRAKEGSSKARIWGITFQTAYNYSNTGTLTT